MDHAYSDILGLRRPEHTDDLFSRRHPRMTRLNRAKLFAPFAALSGFDTAVRAKETPYVARRVPDADEARALDRALNRLYRAMRGGRAARGARARVVYFEVCADANHEACGQDGLYRAISGAVQRVDPVNRLLVIAGKNIPFADIDSIAKLPER